jgi:hypothetical protein
MNKAGRRGTSLGKDPGHAFDPARFRVDLIDPAVDAIPAHKVDFDIDMRLARYFGSIPLAASIFYPPQARLLILLSALQKLQPPDLEGGWYKLSAARYGAALLHDKDVRARAIAAGERRGAIETLRRRAKTTYVRFTETARLAHQVLPSKQRRPSVARL